MRNDNEDIERNMPRDVREANKVTDDIEGNYFYDDDDIVYYDSQILKDDNLNVLSLNDDNNTVQKPSPSPAIITSPRRNLDVNLKKKITID